eukprot:TRINITY_DN20421_c0_g1_i4.p1 TRINITY_DN20421_c0_g1~~TRINITY_DN20421_c0_g1_i4.p1  ORF type:complete len:332 (+),score=15.11 TRINITY_DN20421_c0_g1_i4:82-1077(+)
MSGGTSPYRRPSPGRGSVSGLLVSEMLKAKSQAPPPRGERVASLSPESRSPQLSNPPPRLSPSPHASPAAECAGASREVHPAVRRLFASCTAPAADSAPSPQGGSPTAGVGIRFPRSGLGSGWQPHKRLPPSQLVPRPRAAPRARSLSPQRRPPARHRLHPGGDSGGAQPPARAPPQRGAASATHHGCVPRVPSSQPLTPETRPSCPALERLARAVLQSSSGRSRPRPDGGGVQRSALGRVAAAGSPLRQQSRSSAFAQTPPTAPSLPSQTHQPQPGAMRQSAARGTRRQVSGTASRPAAGAVRDHPRPAARRHSSAPPDWGRGAPLHRSI